MSSPAALFRSLFEITRGDLESASFRYVRPSEHLRTAAAVRLARISGFWQAEENGSDAVL
jgi:hypothetical protein